MIPAQDHPREAERLALLRACGVLDTQPEPDFDSLVDLAAASAGTPVALVSLIDSARQWFKARYGLNATETPRSLAFCAHAILDPEHMLVVPNALEDERFHDNPLVTGAPGVVFYAGVPLRLGPERLPVGTLCVIDHHARDLHPSQRRQLELLARQVELQLDLRRRQRALEDHLAEVRLREERITAVVAAMDEGLVVQGRDGTILSCNAAAERILGLSRDQICGRGSLDPRWRTVRTDGSPFPGDEHPAMVTLRTGQPQSGVIMGVGLEDGQLRWILINSQPVGRSEDGLPEAVAATFTDITRLRREEEERRRVEGQMEHFFNLSLDMLCVADVYGYFRHLNSAWTRVLGWSMEELLARPFFDFVHPEDRAATLAEAAHLALGGSTVRFQNRYRCRDGSWKLIEWTSVGVPEHGVMYGAARDVTKDREREDELVAARKAAEEAARAKSTFLATMSHEIRTPMNGVLGMAEMLAATHLDEHQRDLLDTIRRSGASLLGIINDILDWSKIQAGHLDLKIEPTLLRPVVDDVLGALRSTAREKHLALTCGPIDGGLTVRADPLRLRQVLTNLVGNALKFTERGGVTVAVSTSDRQVQVDIIDTGIGISAEHLPRLFTRFAQVDDANTRRFGGTGLGLAISLQLAEGMGGSIRVVSQPDRGSTFSLILQRAESPQLPSGPVGSARLVRSARSRGVLVAEDNIVNQKVVGLMLKRLGHQVVMVNNGAEALAADLAAIDVILMDVQMPEMDGLEATRRIRQRELASGGRRVPILALTAAALQEEQAACLSAGMDAVLTKPLDLERLRQAIDALP